jgi:tRNA-dihydrouridine synthase B
MNKPDFWTENLNIGESSSGKQLSVPRFMAAPLDGITDSTLRRLIRRYSPSNLLFGEMNHVASVSHKKSDVSVIYDKIEHPLAYQVSANRLDFIDRAVDVILKNKFKMIDLNSGCPARCVVKSGSGSALMADIPRLVQILRSMKKAINGRCPLSLKIRAGFKVKNAVDVAMAAQDEGINLLTIHPRTQVNPFTEPLDLEIVAKVKSKISIPLVFSGNINSFARAKKMHEATGVDGFMIGRALWGAPWKIKEISENSVGREFNLDSKEAVKCSLDHLRMNLEHYGPGGLHKLKAQLGQYIRGVENAAKTRGTLLRITDPEIMEKALISLLED